MEKFGIDNIQKVLQFGIKLGVDASAALKDGFQMTDVFTLLPDLMQLPDLIKNKQAIVNEVNDLSITEIETLITSVENSAIITSAQVKAIISDALTAITSIYNLIEVIKNPIK